MRVAFLLDRLGMGGAERHTVDLARDLSLRGFSTAIVPYLAGTSSNLEVDGSVGLYPQEQRSLVSPLGWRRLASAINEINPELVVAVNQRALVLATVSRPFWAEAHPLLCILHTTVVAGLAGNIRLPIFRAGVAAADGLTFVSRNQAAYWAGRGLRARATATIVNGIDTDAFGLRSDSERLSARRRLGIDPGVFLIGMCAQFRPEKNHGQLLEAVLKLRTEGLAVRVLFVGDGPTRAAVASFVDAHELSEIVIFTGEQRDVRPFTAALDVGVICSTSVETLSLAALEMMSMGIPMVMSDIGGASEMISDGLNGFLFPVGNTDSLLEKLRRLSIPQASRAFGLEAHRTVLDRFRRETMVGEYAQLFESYMDANKRFSRRDRL